MKNTFILLAIVLLSNPLFSQQELMFHIDHKLGVEDFSFNLESENNLSNKLTVTRLEYYISEITIIHDGGQETKKDDFWILANANEDLSVSLGEFDLSEVEGVTFFIGVDTANNHKDPATWPNDHPLAPKSPSMHWGWTSGYRFVAMEGKAGDDLSSGWELHGLGDKNYASTTIMLEPTIVNDVIQINLEADYSKALENIDVVSGPISHGETGAAKKCLDNFTSLVFSAAETVTSSVNELPLNHFNIYPNPSLDGDLILELPGEVNGSYLVSVADVFGKIISSTKETGKRTFLQLTEAGVYFIHIYSDKFRFRTQRVVVQ